MELESLVKKQSRLKKIAKKRVAKTSGTFSGQVNRGKVNRGYSGKRRTPKVLVKI